MSQEKNIQLIDFSEIGLLTIGPHFGGVIDDAARRFKDAHNRVSGQNYYRRCSNIHGYCKNVGVFKSMLLFAASLQGLSPSEFVEGMKKKGIRIPGIGHRYFICLSIPTYLRAIQQFLFFLQVFL